MSKMTVAALMTIMLCSTVLTAACLGGDDGPSVSDERNFSGTLSAEEVLLTLENLNGDVEVSTWDEDGYDIEIDIEAKGDSEEEAQERLDALIIDFDESTFQGRRELSLTYDIPISFLPDVEIDVRVRLPSAASIDLDISSSNGDLIIEEVEGRSIVASTSNGDIELDEVTATTIDASTSNGRIRGDMQSSQASLVSSNGRIEVTVPGMFGGAYDMTTTNADILLTVPNSTLIGYDLDLSTMNGDVMVELQDIVYIVDEEGAKDGVSEGFEDKDVQLYIEATTSNGDVEVRV